MVDQDVFGALEWGYTMAQAYLFFESRIDSVLESASLRPVSASCSTQEHCNMLKLLLSNYFLPINFFTVGLYLPLQGRREFAVPNFIFL